MTHVAGFLRRRASQSVQEWIALESVCVRLLMRLQCPGDISGQISGQKAGDGHRHSSPLPVTHKHKDGISLDVATKCKSWIAKGSTHLSLVLTAPFVENLTDAAPV